MCAAGGKIILSPAFHTILYHHPKFHEIIFQIDKITVISASPSIFPPNSPQGDPTYSIFICDISYLVDMNNYILYHFDVFYLMTKEKCRSACISETGTVAFERVSISEHFFLILNYSQILSCFVEGKSSFFTKTFAPV